MLNVLRARAAEHEERIAALERAVQALLAASRPLQAYNAAKIEQAARVREAIRQVLAGSEEPRRLTSKQVLKQLDLPALGCPHLSLRTVWVHLRALRGRIRVCHPNG